MVCPAQPNTFTLGTSPVKHNFTTVIGDTFTFVVTVQDADGNAKDFTGYTGKMTFNFSTPYSSTATMGGTAGTFTIDVTPALSTANFETSPPTFEYGCEWTNGTTDTREFLRGSIVVREGLVT